MRFSDCDAVASFLSLMYCIWSHSSSATAAYFKAHPFVYRFLWERRPKAPASPGVLVILPWRPRAEIYLLSFIMVFRSEENLRWSTTT